MILSSPSLICQTAKPKVLGSVKRPLCRGPSVGRGVRIASAHAAGIGAHAADPDGRVSASFCMTSGPVILSLDGSICHCNVESRCPVPGD